MGHFVPKMVHPLTLDWPEEFFFKILQSERGQYVHESFISCFSGKKSIQIDLFSL